MATTNYVKPPAHPEEQRDEILTLAEAAAYLKVKKRTLYDRAQRKTIPHLRVGKLIRFSKSSLLNWMKQESGY